MFLNKVFDDSKIVYDIYNNKKVRRYIWFITGVIFQAIAFNIFILPSNMVFGVSGVSIVIKALLGINPAYMILIINILLIVASLAFLGKDVTKYTVMGAILYPVLVELTSAIPSYIDLGATEPVIIAITGAALYGLGTGMVFRAGYTTGGTDVLKQIVSKFTNKSVGASTLYVEGVIVTFGIFVFGWQSFIYSVISLAIISFITDKVMLGISEYKSFQIITSKEKEIKQFINNQLNRSIVMVESKSGHIDKHKYLLFCTVPTKEYFLLKEGITRIDEDAFFIVTDTYEVNGLKKKVG